jgi:hypothetical protein
MPGEAWPWKKIWSPPPLALEEVVHAHLVQAGGARVRGDVATDPDPGPLRPVHEHRGVPPDVGAQPPLDVFVAGEPGLPFRRDGVDVVGRREGRDPDLSFPGPFQQAQHDVAGALGATRVDHAIERLDPFGGFLRVGVGQLAG